MTAVLDASALAVALLGTSTTARGFRRRITVETTHAPHLVDHRHEMTDTLARRAWTLRDRVTFYGALYVGSPPR